MLPVNFEKFTSLGTLGCDWSLDNSTVYIEVNFSKLTQNNQIFRNDFVYIQYHLCKISA